MIPIAILHGILIDISAVSYTHLKKHWEYEHAPMTRFFGGTQTKYQTDITTLTGGISKAGLKMEYILFDDCYMSTVLMWMAGRPGQLPILAAKVGLL